MSFFLFEVSLLDIQDKQMIENVCKLVLNGGLEEERDATSAADHLKAFSVAHDDLMMRHSSLFLIAVRTHQVSDDNYLHADHSEIFSPPPESLPTA